MVLPGSSAPLSMELAEIYRDMYRAWEPPLGPDNYLARVSSRESVIDVVDYVHLGWKWKMPFACWRTPSSWRV